MSISSPTSRNYGAMTEAYNFFNRCLFDGALPECLITLQRKGGTLGYFAGERFGTADGQGVTDEIALNPSHFKERTAEQVLSTLVHEMAHLWQYHHGKISRAGYHDRQWARKMQEIGLISSSTGAEGGKKTGQKMSHYIEPDGKFSDHCSNLLKSGFTLPYIELWDECKAKSKAKSKTKFTCPECGANAWGKPELKVICACCDEPMIDEAI
jgi:hypothetical protein